MSNVREDRHVEGDWWPEPIPGNVEFGDGFYCETAQIFRKLRSKEPRAVIIGNHVSCYAGCSFAIGENGHCTIGDFPPQRRAHYGRRKDRNRIVLSCFLECW